MSEPIGTKLHIAAVGPISRDAHGHPTERRVMIRITGTIALSLPEARELVADLRDSIRGAE